MRIALLLLTMTAGPMLADGGAIRCSERRGDRIITVFTSPTPLRAGSADVSVLVQDAASGRALFDVPIVVATERQSVVATTDAATNKLLHAATLDFPTPGRYRIEVRAGAAELGFDVDVDEAPPAWLDMGLWIGWPAAAIGFFALHRWLASRRNRRSST